MEENKELSKEEIMRPTEELEAIESKPVIEIPWTIIIIVGVLTLLAIIAIIMIYVFGGPINTK